MIVPVRNLDALRRCTLGIEAFAELSRLGLPSLVYFYCLEHRIFPRSGFSLRIEQGENLGRPSVIYLRAREIDGQREISVGGSVILTVRGELA